jgi:hypothetical protein
MLWEDACSLIKGLFKADVLWSLFTSIATDFSWVDFGILCANLLKYVLAGATTGVGAALLFATDVTLWVLNVVNDGISWVKACVPPGSSAIVKTYLLTLLAAVERAIANPKYVTLTNLEHFDILNALMEPHWTRIVNGGPIVPPDTHLSGSLTKLLPEHVAHDPALAAFLLNHFSLRSLSPAAQSAAVELRRAVDRDLLNH